MAKVVAFKRPGRQMQRRRPLAWGLSAAGVAIVLVAAYATGLYPPGPRDGVTADPSEGRFALCSAVRRSDCVIDGDTIRVRDERIRLEDINAPEMSRPRCDTERELAARARQRLLVLINAGPLEIVDDGGRDRDRYGRLLRRLERDGHSLGAMLVDEGLARPWTGRRRGWCR